MLHPSHYKVKLYSKLHQASVFMCTEDSSEKQHLGNDLTLLAMETSLCLILSSHATEMKSCKKGISDLMEIVYLVLQSSLNFHTVVSSRIYKVKARRIHCVGKNIVRNFLLLHPCMSYAMANSSGTTSLVSLKWPNVLYTHFLIPCFSSLGKHFLY